MDKFVGSIAETENEDLASLNFWVVSDTHLFHSNIVKYCRRPMNHSDLIQSNWYKTVGADDVVLHLGDVAMPGGLEKVRAQRIFHNLPGRKYLILGNHDKPKGVTDKKKFYGSLGFTTIDPFKISGWVGPDGHGYNLYFTHRPGGDEPPYDNFRIIREDKQALNLSGHVHNNLKDITGKFVPDVHPRVPNFSVEIMDYTPVWLPSFLAQRVAELPRAKVPSLAQN